MGRHREFDVEKALDAALCVFWRKGYEGASYADLTAAAGVERPALYAAFGNKEALFQKALARYYERFMDYIPAALKLPTAREVAAHILHHAIDLNTRFPDHTGCLVLNGVLAAPLMALMMRMATNPRVMGRLTLPPGLRIVGWAATAAMSAMVLGLAVSAL